MDQTQPNMELIIPDKKNLTNSSQSVLRPKRDFAKYLSADEINSRLDKIDDSKDAMLVRFLWMSGVRISEAVSLTKANIDFTNYTMTVKWLKSRKYNARIVPLHPELRNLLKVFTAPLNQDAKVFDITRQRAWQITKQYLNCSPHQMRHSFAVNWLRKGGDIVTLHRILGHAKIQTTMEYLKIVPIDQGKELMKISFT